MTIGSTDEAAILDSLIVCNIHPEVLHVERLGFGDVVDFGDSFKEILHQLFVRLNQQLYERILIFTELFGQLYATDEHIIAVSLADDNLIRDEGIVSVHHTIIHAIVRQSEMSMVGTQNIHLFSQFQAEAAYASRHLHRA